MNQTVAEKLTAIQKRKAAEKRSKVHEAFSAMVYFANSIDTGDSDVTDQQIMEVCRELKTRAEHIRNLLNQ